MLNNVKILIVLLPLIVAGKLYDNFPANVGVF
jgi:hypothetical protein